MLFFSSEIAIFIKSELISSPEFFNSAYAAMLFDHERSLSMFFNRFQHFFSSEVCSTFHAAISQENCAYSAEFTESHE